MVMVMVMVMVKRQDYAPTPSHTWHKCRWLRPQPYGLAVPLSGRARALDRSDLCFPGRGPGSRSWFLARLLHAIVSPPSTARMPPGPICIMRRSSRPRPLPLSMYWIFLFRCPCGIAAVVRRARFRAYSS